MPLGRCMSCDRLLAIRPGPQKWGSREVEWRPVAHDRPIHRGCGGALHDFDTGSDEPLLACAKCMLVIASDDDVEHVSCDGDTRDIR